MRLVTLAALLESGQGRKKLQPRQSAEGCRGSFCGERESGNLTAGADRSRSFRRARIRRVGATVFLKLATSASTPQRSGLLFCVAIRRAAEFWNDAARWKWGRTKREPLLQALFMTESALPTTVIGFIREGSAQGSARWVGGFQKDFSETATSRAKT